MVKSQLPVLLFIGSENHLKEKALSELKASILGKNPERGLDYKVFRGGESDIKEVLDCAATFPFSAEKRLIVLKEAEELPSEDIPRLAAYIRKPSRFTCLVLDSKNDSILGDLASVRGFVEVRYFNELPEEEVAKWIRRFLSSHGKRMEEGALEIFTEIQRRDLSRLEKELEKLMAFTGERSEITASDVEELVGTSAVRNVFEIARLVGAGDAFGAVRIASNVLAAGKKPEAIIGILCWHFKNMMRAKALCDKGEAEYRAAAVLGINRRYAPEFFREAKRTDMGRIRSSLKALLEADLDIKRTRFDPETVLEFAVMRLCLG
jgi:DNA polymerase-3 subunit delta